MPLLNCVVHGRVQGVGFRFYVQEQADRLGLRGWVRNLPGGEVEVEAAGDTEGLKELLKTIQLGPVLSRVDSVEVNWGEGEPREDPGGLGTCYRF
jgi:acylphosphatase